MVTPQSTVGARLPGVVLLSPCRQTHGGEGLESLLLLLEAVAGGVEAVQAGARVPGPAVAQHPVPGEGGEGEQARTGHNIIRLPRLR